MTTKGKEIVKSDRAERVIYPEMEVLFWAIKVSPQDDTAVMKLLHSDVNWSELKNLALSQQIIPLLYYRLSNLPDREIITKADFYFKDYYKKNIFRNMMQTRQLFKIIQDLSQKEIRVIPFKGVTLAIQAYGTTDLRLSGDIDLLIPKQNLSEVLTLFEEIGMYPNPPISIWNAIYTDIKRSITCTAEKKTPIDLHWGLFDKLTGFQATKAYLNNYATVQFFGFSIPSFSLEDTCILLSVHGTKHYWESLKWIADIVHIIHNNPDLDLDAIFHKSEMFHCKRIVNSTLQLAQFMGGIEYPEKIQNILNEDPIASKIALEFIIKFNKKTENLDIFDQIRILFLSREHLLDSFGFFLFAIITCPPPKGCHYQLPWLLRPLNFPIQILWRLFRK